MGSSTNNTGSPPLLPVNSQDFQLAQPTSTSLGLVLPPLSSKLWPVSRSPHHGQSASGNGDGALGEVAFWYSTMRSATSLSVLAVAERPTHSPMAKRTSPRR